MPRTPICPEAENFIILKKCAKLEKVKSDSKKESSTTQTPKRTWAAQMNSFVELSATMNGSLFVPENGLKNYGQSLSAACETVATTYNNYYTEKFENIICNYFIYALRTKYSNAKVVHAKQKKQANESSFDHQQRCFYQMFAFKRPTIQNCEKLQALPERKGKMFLNGLYTDGYTCRVLFARKVLPLLPEDNICLELNNFSSEEVNKHFRPCTVDPGRRDPFVSYHGGTDIRRLSLIEYHNMGGSVTQMKEQQKHID
ncbi:hypothetical protein MFLAVUS_007459 [Mucor flavus]|uniref:Uncharacterized protein n=1 Tax=Mucor flavus TaxID=439312 RepID=A0ABP9Z4D1_9FUNG